MSDVPTTSSRSFFSRWLGWIPRGLRAFRGLVVNSFFALLLVFLVTSIYQAIKGPPALKDNTALVLNFKGRIVEQSTDSPRNRIERRVLGGSVADTELREVVRVLEAASKDAKIVRVVLALDDFSGAGQATLGEVASALKRVKASGKQVVAWGSSYSQAQYFLAAHADEVLMHPMGATLLTGMGRTRNYYKDAFDRVGITANVLRVGTFKNAAEPYFANAPSAPSLEAESTLFNGLWGSYAAAIEAARKLPAGAVMQGINGLPEMFEKSGKDFGQLALANKLVDKLQTRDQFRDEMIKRGAADDDKLTFRQISYSDYAARLDLPPSVNSKDESANAVGVIVAQGGIGDKSAEPGSIGGLSMSNQIRKARENKAVKALVLRVDSPGGSAFGSELIRRELELMRTAGKPVIISMSNLAASGGYWIAMSADEIIADPATITGSIGVFGILPTVDKAMQKLSINTGGVYTTWIGGALDPRLPLDPKIAQLVQGTIEHTYADFITKAAAARKTTADKIDLVAQGRVWTGIQAKERGLVDRTGQFAEAVAAARAKAKLPEDAKVVYLDQESSPWMKLLVRFGVQQALEDFAVSLGTNFGLSGISNMLSANPSLAALEAALGPEAKADAAWLAEALKPKSGFATQAHCLCGTEP